MRFASTLEGVTASQRQMRDTRVVRCGILKGMVCPSAEEARLIEKLSEENAGFSAVDAMVEQLGAPSGSLFLCEGEKRAEIMANVSEEEWIDVEFEVALDSGSTDHVCHKVDLPGYPIEESPGSRAGQGFIVGNGARVTNDGQSLLSLQGAGDKEHTMSTTFQVAKVSRPLMSVGRLCDKGFDVLFKKDRADVLVPDNTVILSFERQQGGLYVAKLRLKRPASPFGRQGR